MTCPLCADRYPRSWGEHLSPDGRSVLGPCLSPEEHAAVTTDDRTRARLAEACERVRGFGSKREARLIEVVTHLQRSSQSEEDDDGDQS